MPDTIRVDVLDFVAAPGGLRARGLIGWIRLRLPGVLLEDVAVRLSASGRTILSFPKRRGRTVVRPEDDAAHRAIEQQVVTELRRRGDVP